MKGLTVKDILDSRPEAVSGRFVQLEGERWYRIENYDAMPPFFMTIVSSSDVWNYIWSNGGLTAGRINSDHAVFPYYTADKVSDARSTTGSLAVIRVARGDDVFVWEPFSENARGLWDVKRTLYKNESGSRVMFEETNRDLGLTYRYQWTSSDRFGLVKKTEVINDSGAAVRVSALDGCRNILPACVTSEFQNANSVLLDAYKRGDIEATSKLAVFSVTSIVSDKAEPSEGLLANVSWFSAAGRLSLSESAPEAFRQGRDIPEETAAKGIRPAFFIQRDLSLESGKAECWYQAFDTSLNHSKIADLERTISDRKAALSLLEKDIEDTASELERLIANADGVQSTASDETCVHHKANVMFNIMRGGIFADDDWVDMDDFFAFATVRNRMISGALKDVFSGLGKRARIGQLKDAARKSGNPQFERMALEYMPLTFSRRHGDPSRPWNRFSIELKDASGKRKLNYQGNWRDIFQNWEALAMSWPQFTESMSAKFLNAMTADGFNPYRVTRDGIDWEVQEPDNPWSNIGYWGDHQVIYLAKLLELREKFDRDGLVAGLGKRLYTNANVPYRIKPYADIVKNPRDTIHFDVKLHERIVEREASAGTDARLVLGSDGLPALESMTAKFVALVGAKMANLVPHGGIWLNTQRPEWNDANNALAGWGLSIVTLCYLRRFLVFLLDLYGSSPDDAFPVSADQAAFFRSLAEAYGTSAPDSLSSPARRRAFVDRAQGIYETFRNAAYSDGGSASEASLSKAEILRGFRSFLDHAEASIRSNRRADGLYHSYNTLEIKADGGMEIHYLSEMLEGQVAVLSSGMLPSEEALALLESLRKGPLYRKDQHSYILYPNKELPPFTGKNRVSAEDAMSIATLRADLESGKEELMSRDSSGACHFNHAFPNARVMQEKLDARGVSADEAARIQALYEKTFNHRQFTGRSGTFYAYEGLGSIYWHMVSKLLLACQEYFLAERDPALRAKLAERYYDIRSGIGFNKRPEEYGAFPSDPYSHTPAGQGAKQPGMTGQVKEEVLTRWGELGISVKGGIVSFSPDLLKASEFRADGTLEFSWCGKRVIYRAAKDGERESVTVTVNGADRVFEGGILDKATSTLILTRDPSVSRVAAVVTPGL